MIRSAVLLVVGVVGYVGASIALPEDANGAHSGGDVGTSWHHPCISEDGPGPCFWNANNRGNDHGTEYHLTRRERVFVPTKDADGHDGCWIHVKKRSIIRCDDGYRTTKS